MLNFQMVILLLSCMGSFVTITVLILTGGGGLWFSGLSTTLEGKLGVVLQLYRLLRWVCIVLADASKKQRGGYKSPVW